MKYSVLDTITISSGEISLTALQAAPRKQSLRALKVDKKGNGIYEVIAPVQFKRSEVIELARPGKQMLGRLKKAA